MCPLLAASVQQILQQISKVLDKTISEKNEFQGLIWIFLEKKSTVQVCTIDAYAYELRLHCYEGCWKRTKPVRKSRYNPR